MLESEESFWIQIYLDSLWESLAEEGSKQPSYYHQELSGSTQEQSNYSKLSIHI